LAVRLQRVPFWVVALHWPLAVGRVVGLGLLAEGAATGVGDEVGAAVLATAAGGLHNLQGWRVLAAVDSGVADPVAAWRQVGRWYLEPVGVT
jgi:hypothetical protein